MSLADDWVALDLDLAHDAADVDPGVMNGFEVCSVCFVSQCFVCVRHLTPVMLILNDNISVMYLSNTYLSTSENLARYSGSFFIRM